MSAILKAALAERRIARAALFAGETEIRRIGNQLVAAGHTLAI
jgi:uncharacterized protein YjeT (DUF2065 family)